MTGNNPWGMRVILVALFASTGCGDGSGPDLERMIDQASYRAYERSPRFEDHRAMRPPPEGTIAVGRPLSAPGQLPGMIDDRYVTSPPMPVNAAFVQRGQDRYNIFCAACHGVDGTANTPVAHNMKLHPAPSLVTPPVRSFALGQLYGVITQGYGLMPNYAYQLAPTDRWAVATYVKALGLSQHSRFDELPPWIQAEAQANLPGKLP